MNLKKLWLICMSLNYLSACLPIDQKIHDLVLPVYFI